MKSDKAFNSLPDIPLVATELYTKRDYFWDNAERQAENGWVIQQTLNGSAYFQDASGRQRVGKGQAMIFGYAEESCYGLDEASDLPYQLRWIHIVGHESLRVLVEEIRQTFGSVLHMSEKGEAGQLLRRLQEDFQSGNVRDRFYLADCAFRLLIALYREQISDIRGNDPVSYGRHLLATRYRSPRNLKEWTDEIGITREHFTREFHQRYGETPACFLRRLRLVHAQGLLKNQTLTLPDVASASGFASPQTFYRAYKQMYGQAPGQDR
jgi:AraC-like DNA-binding protein